MGEESRLQGWVAPGASTSPCPSLPDGPCRGLEGAGEPAQETRSVIVSLTFLCALRSTVGLRTRVCVGLVPYR